MLTVVEVRKQSAELYMSDDQLEFFKQLLLSEKVEAKLALNEARAQLYNDTRTADMADFSDAETQRSLAISMIERQKQRLGRVDYALKAIEDKEYGYCEMTGEQIGIERLIACPSATISAQGASIIEARERHMRRSA